MKKYFQKFASWTWTATSQQLVACFRHPSCSSSSCDFRVNLIQSSAEVVDIFLSDAHWRRYPEDVSVRAGTTNEESLLLEAVPRPFHITGCRLSNVLNADQQTCPSNVSNERRMLYLFTENKKLILELSDAHLEIPKAS